VIERWVSEKTGSTEKVVSADLTTYKAYATGQYLPYQRFSLNSATPPTNFVPSAVSGSFTKDSRHLAQETANTYDATGRVTQVADARGKLTNYLYGGNPNSAFLTKVTRVKDSSGPIDLVTDLAYDTKGNLASIKDEGGTFRYFTYDAYGRLRQIKNHGSLVVNAFGYTYSRTVANSWTFQPSSPNLVLDTVYRQHTPSVARVVSRQYLDGRGRPIQSALQDGTSYFVEAQQYDGMGRDWRTWKPFTRTSASYDPSFASNATSFYNTYLGVSNAKPYAEAQYTPDALARPDAAIPEYTGASPSASVTHAYGTVSGTKLVYDETTDESGKKTRSFRDVFGNEVQIVLGYGATGATTTNLAYDVLGQRTQLTDPRGLLTTYTRNTRGLLTARTSPDAGTTQHKYDKGGNLRYTLYANKPTLVEFTTYDFASRPLVLGRGTATFSTLDPDAASAPALETTQANWVIVRKYDAKPTNVFPWSLFWTQISPLTLSNVAGRQAAIATKSNGAWQVELLSYDTDGRIATRRTFTQNNAGSAVLTAMNTTATYTYDLRGQITKRALTVGSQTFNQWYDYNGRGLLWRVFASTAATKPGTADVTYLYRPSGEIQSRQFQGGPLVPLRYTIREQLEKIGDPAVTTYPFSARYAYHPNGTISESEFYSAGSPTQKRYRYTFGTASYDALNRLKSADFSPWSGSAWTSTLAHDLTNIAYDLSGNLTTLRRYRQSATLIDNLTYSYPGGSNRLSSIAEAAGTSAETWDAEAGSSSYDASGNLLTAPAPHSITAATYGYRHMPISVTAGGVTTTYRYNEAGERIARQVGSGNAEVHLQEGRTTLGVYTLNGSGTPTAWHFNLLAGTRAMGRQPNTGNRRYYHTDLLGSTRSVVAGATVVESYDYDPWGVLMPGRTLGSGTREGFTGKERDAETGLDYFGARYYMPALGRWTTVDPPADDFPSWSPYNYVYDNPVNYSDPYGLCPQNLSYTEAFVCNLVEAGSTAIGGTIGFIGGGGGGALAAVATAGVGAPAIPAGAWAGAGVGAAGGLAFGKLVTGAMFREGSGGSSRSTQRSIRSLEQRVQEHQQKLDAYRRDPDAFDNQGLLKNAPSDEARQRIIQGRIRHLENEIRTFQRRLDQLRGQ
jgi:RHS repeat-associated protein